MDRLEAERIVDAGRETAISAIIEMAEAIRVLTERVAALTRNFRNSSKPPSLDGPQVVKPKKKPSGRKPGGRKGRKGSARDLPPVEEMEVIIDHYPASCDKCAVLLEPGLCLETSDPARHQTFELPRIEPIKTEHRCHELGCSCGHRTRARLPAAVARTQFGPRAHAALAYLAPRHGLVEIFLRHEGVDPTNNLAERALRPAVQWRKICFGNQSENGEQFTARILTVARTCQNVARTCQKQGRNAYHFLTDLMDVAFKGTPRPALV